jgi:homoserine O-succinyltransferase/O-acetyltransferase
MNWNDGKRIRVAILDLYEGKANEGMRCLREILNQFGEYNHLDLSWDEFDVRLKNEVPDTSYDIYISSGGPGSPLDSEGSEWERVYFHWLHHIEKWNNDPANLQKKYVFFICHSFQLACRHYKVAHVSKRRSTAFGVFPIHLMHDGQEEVIFDGLNDPFYVVDSRDFQVVQPHHNQLRAMGAKILCIEKERPHIPLDTQFHPEADAVGMSMYLQREDKKKTVIENHGEEKWHSMIEHLNDPDKIMWTYSRILPNFLQQATGIEVTV